MHELSGFESPPLISTPRRGSDWDDSTRKLLVDNHDARSSNQREVRIAREVLERTPIDSDSYLNIEGHMDRIIKLEEVSFVFNELDFLMCLLPYLKFL